MYPMVILVMLNPDDNDAEAFRSAVAGDPELKSRVELRFATGSAALEAAKEAEVIVMGHVTPELLAAASHLHWLAFWSAGLDNKISPELKARPELLITNASGVHGPNIAEHVMTYMLMFRHAFLPMLKAQERHEWFRFGNTRSQGPGELYGETLGIVGLGRIGEDLAKRAKAFGMRVVATKRNPDARYDTAIQPDAIYPMDALPRLLSESDHLCIATPYTPETHHLINASMLAHMKPTAYLYNIARGKIIDEAALVAALQSGRLAGAGLDVFETEPLPADSPLWNLENVILTPHVSGGTPHYFSRFARLFADNLRRFLHNEPLHNRYNPSRDY